MKLGETDGKKVQIYCSPNLKIVGMREINFIVNKKKKLGGIYPSIKNLKENLFTVMPIMGMKCLENIV